MNAPAYFSFPQHWTAQDLANAVPLRLSQLLDFDAVGNGCGACANASSSRRRALAANGYLSIAALPRFFRIR